MITWQQINERDRYVLIGGILFLLIVLIDLFIVSPLFSSIEFKQRTIIEKRSTLEWMSHLPRGTPLKSTNTTKNPTQILTLISQQLSASVFKSEHYQLQQLGNQDIQLSFDQVPYTQFVAWLWVFTEQNQLSIRQLNIERTNVVGAVKLQVILQD